MSRPIDEALEACLAAIEAGTPAAEVLARLADPAEREALAPLIADAAALADLPPMDAARSAAIQAELARAELALYPTPAGGLPQMPHAPLLLAALVGAALLAWLAVDRSPAGTAPEGQPPRTTGSIRSTQSISSRANTPPPEPGTPGESGSSAPAGRSAANARSNPAPPIATTNTELPPPPTSAAIARPPDTAPSPTPSLPSPTPSLPSQASAPDASPLPESGAGAAEPGEAGEGVAITGKVTDPAGRGIEGAEVSAYRLGAPGFYVQRTEADGGYRLRLRPGAYVFQARTDGYTTRWYAGATRRGDATVVDVAPERPPAGVDFTLEPAHNTPNTPSASDPSGASSPEIAGASRAAAGTPARAAGLAPQGGQR